MDPVPSVDYTPLSQHPQQKARAAFAAANGWEFLTDVPRQGLPGVIFREPDGHPRTSQIGSSIVRMGGDPWTEVGNSVYLESVQLGPFAVRWGYVAVRMAACLPHVVVTTPGADRLPSLPAAEYARSAQGAAGAQIYAAAAAQEWASRAFSPALIAQLADPALPLSAELSEGWLLVYAPGTLSTTDAATWQRLFAVREALIAALGAAGAAPTDSTPMPLAAPPSGSGSSTALPMHERTTPEVRGRRGVLIGIPVAIGAIIAVTVILTQVL